jgi:hypothetical protein
VRSLAHIAPGYIPAALSVSLPSLAVARGAVTLSCCVVGGAATSRRNLVLFIYDAVETTVIAGLKRLKLSSADDNIKPGI